MMSFIVDNFSLKFMGILRFFHRRLCHKVEMCILKFRIFFQDIMRLQIKCEYLIQYYVPRHDSQKLLYFKIFGSCSYEHIIFFLIKIPRDLLQVTGYMLSILLSSVLEKYSQEVSSDA